MDPEQGRVGLTSVSKAFNYVMNTTQEDQKVAKTLTGWSHNAQAQLPNLQAFDEILLRKILQLQSLMFSAVTGIRSSYSLSEGIIEVFMASIILHYNDMLALNESVLYICNMREKMSKVGVTGNEITSWALTIQASIAASDEDEAREQAPGNAQSIDKQTQLILQLTKHVEALEARIKALESAKKIVEQPPPSSVTTTACTGQQPANTIPYQVARRSSAKSLSPI